jgi:hypothetical protein
VEPSVQFTAIPDGQDALAGAVGEVRQDVGIVVAQGAAITTLLTRKAPQREAGR